jgi:Pvc16 N-terminal domain/Carboxypeptidase regulatory-like domain
MIRDLSETLQAILDDPNLPEPLKSASIVFDRPTEPFNPTHSTVDLFLYDIRENLELRSNEPTIERHNGQATIRRPPLRVAGSYLVTAWPGGVTGDELVLQEHRLLSQVLQVFARYPTIPEQFLKGSLKSQEPPLPLVALHPDALKNLSEFWTSLGNKLRPSLTVTVTISLPVFADVTEPIVTTKFAGFDVGTGVVEETLIQIGGRVFHQVSNPTGQLVAVGIAEAIVDILDIGLRAKTDAEGRYSFLRVPAGSHTIRAIAVGFEPKTQPLIVPGQSADYEITLTPLS